MHHYHGRGGRVYPLWRDRAATQPNIKPALLTHLAKVYGQPVKAEDVMAYVAAVMAHPAFTARFAPDLVRPGLRVPLTADAGLFAEAVALGREVIWLHCYGERFSDPTANWPKQAPRLPKEHAPYIPADGAIPSAPEPLPDTMDYDPAKRRLKIGKGYVENVTPQMWGYEVSGKQVLRHWFSYRRRDRSPPHHRRPPSAVAARQHPAGQLAAGIYDRPPGPAARPRPSDRFGTRASRPVEPRLREPAAERRRTPQRRSIHNHRG
jgi:hypothetical protein